MSVDHEGWPSPPRQVNDLLSPWNIHSTRGDSTLPASDIPVHVTSKPHDIPLPWKSHLAFKRGQYPQEILRKPRGIFFCFFFHLGLFPQLWGERGECSLSMLVKFTKHRPAAQLCHFICLSRGSLKWCEKVEFHLTDSKSWLIGWHSPSCPGGNGETFQNALVTRARCVRGGWATKCPSEAPGAEKGLLLDFRNKLPQKRNLWTSLHTQMASHLPCLAQMDPASCKNIGPGKEELMTPPLWRWVQSFSAWLTVQGCWLQPRWTLNPWEQSCHCCVSKQKLWSVCMHTHTHTHPHPPCCFLIESKM